MDQTYTVSGTWVSSWSIVRLINDGSLIDVATSTC